MSSKRQEAPINDAPDAKRAKPDELDEDDDVTPMYRPSTKQKRKGTECPYLDTIDRHALDFDFEKLCSVSLSNLNTYACLVCGKYFQGRAYGTHAHTHSVEQGHHMFIKLETGHVFCLPDGYEVEDPSLKDIQHVLNPTYSVSERLTVDKNTKLSRSLDGVEYIPGLIGLNNLKMTDYANVVLQGLVRVKDLRDFFLDASNYAHCKSVLPHRFGEFVRKNWNSRNFKGQVSPHEIMQCISVLSKKAFTVGKRSDPLEFLGWFLDNLHKSLGGTKEPGSSIVYKCFQGEVQITTIAKYAQTEEVKRVPFIYLSIAVPPAPLFKDELERNLIPQVPLFNLLGKFDSVTEEVQFNGDIKKYSITRLPAYPIFHFKRFSKNKFFTEKNPTIVNFPCKNLDISDYCPELKGANTKFNLLANAYHMGDADGGVFKVHVLNKANDTWYDVEDLHVQETLPQLVALSPSYIQIYEVLPEAPAAPEDVEMDMPKSPCGSDVSA